MDNSPKIKRESKNKIRVDFERAPLSERLKAKFLNSFFFKKVLFMIFKLVLLVGVSYVILYPYITKIFGSFMSPSDFEDVTVVLISKNPTIDQYKYIIIENEYFLALLNTFLISASVALIQTLVCALVAYGLAKFKFKGSNLLFLIVIFTMMVPQESIQYSMQIFFTRYGTSNPIGYLLKAIGVIDIGFINSLAPLYIMSITGLGFKNGLFIFMLRQFFKGVPDELEESAYVDGSSTFRTFFNIILPISVPMLVTVFIFAFAWQWTDEFYASGTSIFYLTSYWSSEDAIKLISNIATVPKSLQKYNNGGVIASAVRGTASILIVLPLIIVYLFVQNKIVEGVERSGIVG